MLVDHFLYRFKASTFNPIPESLVMQARNPTETCANDLSVLACSKALTFNLLFLKLPQVRDNYYSFS